jgi:EAL domain-containing protein (putative c-di-GMP-specific phosphodiesterase class I)
MAIEDGLRHAVRRDQLELHYQPLIDLVDGRVVGFDALVRWRHSERGLLVPAQFIPVLEETGLIVAIGSWVLGRVCAQLAQWPEEIYVSANLSARQIPPALVVEVEQLLADHAITPAPWCSRSPRAWCSTRASSPSSRACAPWVCSSRSTTSAPATPRWAASSGSRWT